MGVSLSIEGIIPGDETWAKMKAVYAACEAAGIEPPEAVTDFFAGVSFDNLPDERTVEIWDENPAVTKLASEHGYLIDLDGLRQTEPHVKFVRVFLSW